MSTTTPLYESNCYYIHIYYIILVPQAFNIVSLAEITVMSENKTK